MHPSYYYSSPEHQQFQSPQWTSSPSFYNGYSTNIPVVVHQPKSIIQNYYPQTEQQQQHHHHHHHQQFHHYQPQQQQQQISSTHPSSMKSYNVFRNAFSCSNQQDANNSDQEFYYHEQQLNRNLAEYGIQRLPVKGDGNCLFYALAEGLIYEMKLDRDGFGLHIRQLMRLPINFRLVDFADRLRQACVDQWRLHEDYYSQFVDTEKVSFLKEVKKFSKSGVSDSILGDIVPLTIANTLNINIVIFTSVSDLPRIDVKPEHKNNLASSRRKTIYLAYNQYGIGHYDAAYPRT